jgi:hypothetical protein
VELFLIQNGMKKNPDISNSKKKKKEEHWSIDGGRPSAASRLPPNWRPSQPRNELG